MDWVHVIARRKEHRSHGCNFYGGNAAFCSKDAYVWGQTKYVLLGDLLSMYAVNRSSKTACQTGDLNKHLLTDSNKMINYAEIHVCWIDIECDSSSARVET